jgi:hypothetical protein
MGRGTFPAGVSRLEVAIQFWITRAHTKYTRRREHGLPRRGFVGKDERLPRGGRVMQHRGDVPQREDENVEAPCNRQAVCHE